MSVRVLAIVAASLGILLVAAAALAAHRFGWVGGLPPPPPIRFVNHLVDAQSRQEFFLHPQIASKPVQRWVVDHLVDDPNAAEDPSLAHGHPHVLFATGELDLLDTAAGFKATGIGGVLLDRLGALGESESLERMRVVIERRDDGSERPVIEAEYARSQGGRTRYYYDPDAPVPPVGWFRVEATTPAGPSEILFARARAD